MREIRLSGSEGGGAELNRPSLPLSKTQPGIDRSGDARNRLAGPRTPGKTLSSKAVSLNCLF